ncbi:hypothetical protein COX00_03105 [Candidatus Uhrbacteria bacterium CG22_combo_CG10-13_8_21_14_all_47_17]|uniref:Uncharacterized protein n=1 Tax=Candidatus Uhrbacteria bacterium CG22_combo_CG10-13_8_21_14_all_47_17 TaxID=1975041 RepID=A0A2H0BS31_9BACT|nr:MAG: hypothetical protein COX00_03105 [Candidatus Uhrbacteria bacterium CG22_combo_CG10-13_8_21_14_all_47_17]
MFFQKSSNEACVKCAFIYAPLEEARGIEGLAVDSSIISFYCVESVMGNSYIIEELLGNTLGEKRTQDIEVPDGKWVARASVLREIEDGEELTRGHYHEEDAGLYRIIGTKPEEKYTTETSEDNASYKGIRNSSLYRVFMLVGSEPFGIVIYETTNSKRVGGLYFESARQVHKGELGRGLKVAMPTCAREAREPDPEDPQPRRDRRRHYACWARLSEVAALMGLSTKEVLERFHLFADADARGVPVLFASKRDEIHGKVISKSAVKRFKEAEFPQLFDRDLSTIWVRQGFAKTVLRLHALNYTPD